MRASPAIRAAAVALFVALGAAAPTALRAQSTQAGAPATVTAPDTPAGRVLQAWLDAFDSGDRAQLDAYYRRHQPDRSADEDMDFRAATGGFDLVAIRTSEPRHVEFVVKERKSDTRARGTIDLDPRDPAKVTSFGLIAIPKGGSLADFAIDAATRARVIDSAIAELDANYVFPDVAKRMADAVRAREKRGDYDGFTDGPAFADTLTADLRAVSHDKHLRVDFAAGRLPVMPSAPDSAARARMRANMERQNCGFDKVEHMPGNVGYLKFDFFADPDVCGPTLVAAMGFLANVDALIVDLRDNSGGAPRMVALVASYLFDSPTHLNDLWERKSNATTQYWTLPYVPGRRLASKPVYVLTSKRTFSGGEEFTYDLKMQRRATIVGETTGGGAHPVSGHRIDEHFVIGVPFARAINPVSKTNWEGVGVEPDVKVPAADALATAQKLAAEKLAER